MAEYSIDLEPAVKAKMRAAIDKIHSTKSTKRMNRLLHQCQELIMSLKFHESDTHHKFLKQSLL